MNYGAEAAILYGEQKFQGVVDLLRPPFDAGNALETPDLLRLGQSAGKVGDAYLAARAYRVAANRLGPSGLQLLDLAFNMFWRAGRDDEAYQAATAILGYDPSHKLALAYQRHNVLLRLDIDDLRQTTATALERLLAGDPLEIESEMLFDHLSWCGDEAVNAKFRHQNGKVVDPARRAERRAWPLSSDGRIRVAYISNDLSDAHATTKLMQRAFDLHDADRFEIRLFCYTNDAFIGSDIAFRTRHADRIERIGHLDTESAAARIRAFRPDIAVDLKGHTDKAWIDLINAGLAPIQVAYLGFPGSGVGIDCDYVVCDEIVCPPTSAPFYEEKLCWMPDSYQVNDNAYRPLRPAFDRADLQLPEGAVVLVSVNAVRKISARTFDLWMAILNRAPQTVLWMMCPDENARQRFLRSAAAAGVAPERIVFTVSIPYDLHIGRLRAADLGLDTFPYNGHTTTSDMLWAGLPVATIRGTNFASRVSESLLSAMGMEDLVAADDDAYVDMCVELLNDGKKRQALRQRLESARSTAPLFDTERFAANLEKAYATMVERARAGLPPDHFRVGG